MSKESLKRYCTQDSQKNTLLELSIFLRYISDNIEKRKVVRERNRKLFGRYTNSMF